MCVPFQSLGATQKEIPGQDPETWARHIGFRKESYARAFGSKTDTLAEAGQDKGSASQTSEPFAAHLPKLIRKGRLDEALQLITKRLREVSKQDPDFFFLNLYAGELAVASRNKLIGTLTDKMAEQKGGSSSISFEIEFIKHLHEYDKPNRQALNYLTVAWNNIHLVSTKDHEVAAKRLTDAFFALVKPYISRTLFAYNSDEIRDLWLPSLDTACTSLNQMPIGKIFLEGHTDDRGDAEHNLVLSKRRAHAVKRYLVSKGIRQGLVTTQGKGEGFPIASNDTPEGRAKNRRVEVILSIRFPSH